MSLPLYSVKSSVKPSDLVATSSSSPSLRSIEVFRGYNLRTPGSVSSAACNAFRRVSGNAASARPMKTSFVVYGEVIDAAVGTVAGMRGRKSCNYSHERGRTWLRCRHVRHVNTCGRLLRCAAGHCSCPRSLYVCMYVCMCSLCTVSVQWSVAQSACVLRALSVHDCVSFSDKGR